MQPHPTAGATSLRARLAAERCLLGTWIQFTRTPSVMRLVADAGFDLVVVDMEHSSFGWETLADLTEMALACGLAPLVRANEIDPRTANRIQDLGAAGILFRDVRTLAEVDLAATAMAYPPAGRRGVTRLGPGTGYELLPVGADAHRRLDDASLLAIQVESRAGVEAIDALLASGRVDLVHIGRSDLSTDLGAPFDLRHPAVVEAVETVVAAGRRHGVAVALDVADLQEARALRARGVRCFTAESDLSLLAAGFRSAAAGLDELRSADATPRRRSRDLESEGS